MKNTYMRNIYQHVTLSGLRFLKLAEGFGVYIRDDIAVVYGRPGRDVIYHLLSQIAEIYPPENWKIELHGM